MISGVAHEEADGAPRHAGLDDALRDLRVPAERLRHWRDSLVRACHAHTATVSKRRIATSSRAGAGSNGSLAANLELLVVKVSVGGLVGWLVGLTGHHDEAAGVGRDVVQLPGNVERVRERPPILLPVDPWLAPFLRTF